MEFVVIPSEARDLLFAEDERKSRFLAPFKKRTGLGMTFAWILRQQLGTRSRFWGTRKDFAGSRCAAA
jgi:hypothetical protein